jgi:hypothetical protein
MTIPTTHRSPTRATGRGFRWSVQGTPAQWQPHGDLQAALDGSDSGSAGCAITPVPPMPRRPRAPRRSR